MKATKKQIDDFIEYEVKVPSSTYSFYERRQAVRYVKNNLSFSSSIFLKECWAVLYHVDRTNIIDNNDLNLLRYLLKLMLYTLNGETDNSWLEDKYKEYHEKYDFSKDKSFTSGAKKEEEDDGIKYVNGELKYKCSDGLAKDILEELDDKKEAYPHILEEYLLQLVLFANKKKTSKKELENILRVLIPELLYKYDTRDIKYVVDNIIKDLPIDEIRLGYSLANCVSSYEIRVEEIDTLVPVYKNMKEILIFIRNRDKNSTNGVPYNNISQFRHVLSTSVNYGSVNQWDNLIRLITGTPTYSNYEIAEFIKGFENESIQTSSLQIAGYIAKYYYDDFVFDLLHKNVDEDLLFSVCNRIGIKEYFYRRYKKVKGVSFSKRDSSLAPKKVSEVCTPIVKKEQTEAVLEYDCDTLIWKPDEKFIDSLHEEQHTYTKNPIKLAQAIWDMFIFVNKENTSEKELKKILTTLCLELRDTNTVFEQIIEKAIDSFMVDGFSFSEEFCDLIYTYNKKYNKVPLLTSIQPSTLEHVLKKPCKYWNKEPFSNMGALKECLHGMIDVAEHLFAVSYLVNNENPSQQQIAEFIDGFYNRPTTTLSESYIAGFIASNTEEDAVKTLLTFHPYAEETICNVCKKIGIKDYFYKEYKKLKGVTYSDRKKVKPKKDGYIKGVGVDLIKYDEVAESVNKAAKEALTHKIGESTTLVTEVGIKKEEEKEVINLNILGKVPAQEINFTLQSDSIDIHKISDGKLEPETILMTEELFKETLDWSKGQSCTIEEKKDPRKEAYIKGVYLGIVRELVKSTKDLILSSYNKNLITTVLGSSVGDVIVSAVLVELLPSINLGAKKEFIEKVVELLRLNVSVAVGEFATGLLLNVGKELAKDNKLQELVKQVVTV